METQTELLVPSNEGDGQSLPATEVQPTEASAADVAANESPVEPNQAQDPSLPPELQPDADGNPPEITEKLLRKLRSRYFTVRHPLLTECGHSLDMINFPKRNCENCFFQFFNTHPQLVEVTDQFFRTHGKGPLVGMRGIKYFKAFTRYMATVIHFMKEEGRLDEQGNVQQAVVSGEPGADSPKIGSGLSLETPGSETMPNSGSI
jgi:hypothetical protein